MTTTRRTRGLRILSTFSAITLATAAAPAISHAAPGGGPVSDALTSTGIVPANAIQDNGEVNEANLEQSTNPKCADIVMVGIPGTFEINQNDDPNEPNGLLGKMAEPLRGQPWFSETYINYVSDAGVNGTSYAKSVDGGVRKTLATLKDIQTRCADSQVFLTGFSQGADIAGDVATLIGNKQADVEPGRIAGVTLFSDPQRSAGTNVIADTSRDVPVLPLGIQDAIDNFVDDKSLAQVQMSINDAKETASNLNNAFGGGGLGSAPAVPSGKKPRITGSTDDESDDHATGSGSTSSSQTETDSPGKDEGAGKAPSGNSGSGSGFGGGNSGGGTSAFGTMTMSSHRSSSTPAGTFSYADNHSGAATFRPAAHVNVNIDVDADLSDLVTESSEVHDTLSTDDQAKLLESMQKWRNNALDHPAEAVGWLDADGNKAQTSEAVTDGHVNDGYRPIPGNFDRKRAATDVYRTGLFPSTTLSSLNGHGASNPNGTLLTFMDADTIGALTGMKPTNNPTPIPDDKADATSTKCLTLRFSDCSTEVDNNDVRSQPVSDREFSSAMNTDGVASYDTASQNSTGSSDGDAQESTASTTERTSTPEETTDRTPEQTPADEPGEPTADGATPAAADESPADASETAADEQTAQAPGKADHADDHRSEPTTEETPTSTSTAGAPRSHSQRPSSRSTSTDTTQTQGSGKSRNSESGTLANLWSGSTTNADGGVLGKPNTDSTADSSTAPTSTGKDSATSSTKTPSKDSTEDSSGSHGSSSRTSGKVTEDVDVDKVTQQGVAGGGLVGERDQGFGDLTGRVASLCSPGDLVCDLAPNSDLAQKLVEVGQNFSVNASDLDMSVKGGDTEGVTRMGGLLAVQAVSQVAEISGLPAPKLTSDSITVLIKLAAGAGLIANGDPTGAGVAMVADTLPKLPDVLPELAAQIGDVPEIVQKLPDAPDTAAKNLGLDKLQKSLSGAFEKAKIGDVTDLAQLPEATAGLIADLLQNNEGLMDMATNPDYFKGVHSVDGFSKLNVANSTNAMDWTSDWIGKVDEQGPSTATSDNVNPRESAGKYKAPEKPKSDHSSTTSAKATSTSSASAATSSSSAPTTSKAPEKGKDSGDGGRASRAIVIGDSTSVGIPDEIKAKLKEVGYDDVVVDAVSGSAILEETNGASGLDRLKSHIDPNTKSDIFMLMGANDSLNIGAGGATGADQRISAVMDASEGQGNVYWPTVDIGSSGDMLDANPYGTKAQYNEGVESMNKDLKAAAEKDDRLIVADGTLDDSAYADGVHYTGEGNKMRLDMIGKLAETAPSKSSDASSGGTNHQASHSAPAVEKDSEWDKIAQCESGGDWSINTGNGFSGGLQFTDQTWKGFGGEEYAATAHEASREEQIAVAKKVKDEQGWGAWPSCTSQLGLS
jgi:hypothetical protein